MKLFIHLIVIFLPGMVCSQYLLPRDSVEQLVHDEIWALLNPALESYYSGDASYFANIVHDHAVYSVGVARVVGKEEIRARLAKWDGKTKMNKEIRNKDFRFIDRNNAVLSMHIQEEEHTLWLGVDHWTRINGQWGIVYAVWNYKDLNLIYGLPPMVFYGIIGLLIMVSFIGIGIGRFFLKKS